MSTSNHHQQAGFTLVEMIMVIVITGIIGGMVAVFLKAPIQQYMDVARRAELTDIADTAIRRMARDVRTAVPNSVRIAGCGATPCVEFLPTRDGGRYRAAVSGILCDAVAASSVANGADALSFTGVDTCFEIIGTPIRFFTGDQIVVGSTQSDGNPPYQDPTVAGCDLAAPACIRRPVPVAGSGVHQTVVMTSAYALPAFAELPSQRFDVVDYAQQAVTYACVGMQGGALDANNNGQGSLMRYLNYGFNPVQVLPTTGGAILADKVRACEIVYDIPNQRFGLLAVRLTLTSGGESVSLYNEIHVNNAP